MLDNLLYEIRGRGTLARMSPGAEPVLRSISDVGGPNHERFQPLSTESEYRKSDESPVGRTRRPTKRLLGRTRDGQRE